MRLTRSQPFSPVWNQMQHLQNEMNRLFNRWGESSTEGLATYPPVNVWEDGDAVWVEAELPGVGKDDLEMFVTGGNQLSLKGERKPWLPEKSIRHRQERAFGTFHRVVLLPFPVDGDKVEAHFENGVLRVKLAKHESAKPRKISVKAQ